MSLGLRLSQIAGAAALGIALSGGMAGAQTPAPAAVDPAVKEKLVAAIVKNGCQVTDNNNEAILADSGVDPATAKNVVQALIADGTAVVANDALLLKTEGCN